MEKITYRNFCITPGRIPGKETPSGAQVRARRIEMVEGTLSE